MIRKRSFIQECSEMLDFTAKIDIWVDVENGKKLGLADKFEINIYMYIYIYIYFSFFFTYIRTQ